MSEEDKSKNKDENVGSFAPDPKELKAQQHEEEAKKLLAESVDPNAPLFKKIDAMITAMNGISHQLCRIADKIGAEKSVEVPTEKPDEKPTEKPAKELPKPPEAISAVMNLFPSDLESKLKFSKEGDKIKVAPRQYLGSENFAKIASIVREAGGEYVSAGKDSHFLVSPPTTQTKSTPTPSEGSSKVSEVKSKFTDPVLADMLTFTEKDGKVIIKAKSYLGSDNFAKIAAIVREIGGEYISDGKNSRFEVP